MVIIRTNAVSKSKQSEDIEYTLTHNNWHDHGDRFKIRVFNELHLLSMRMDDLEDLAKGKVYMKAKTDG
jgi:hypothetical protein